MYNTVHNEVRQAVAHMTDTSPKQKKKRVRGAQRTTRDHWMQSALDTLISEGVESVKVSVLADKLGCARSSFYWFFRDRADLLDALLDHWQSTNTRAIVGQAALAASSINMALINVFSCWTDRGTFDTRLDFAVRDWARRDGSVRRAVDLSDEARLQALGAMFARFGYDSAESAIRARIIYFTQIGYDALDTRDSATERARTGPHYLFCLTGQKPTTEEIAKVVGLAGFDTSILNPPPSGFVQDRT